MTVRSRQMELGGVKYLVVEWRPATLASLTAAERAVAELLALGASNAEIARARRTSVRTVANQVASILRKLDLPSRVAIASAIAGSDS